MIKYFFLLLTAFPEAPSNCEIEDEFLKCEPGHDGGLPQRFILEALEVRAHPPVQGDESTMNDQVSHDDDEYEEIMTCELFSSFFQSEY